MLFNTIAGAENLHPESFLNIWQNPRHCSSDTQNSLIFVLNIILGRGRRLIVLNQAAPRWLKTFILMQACHLTVCSNRDLSGPYSAVIILVLLRSHRTQSFQGITMDCTEALQIEAGPWLPASASWDPRASAFSPFSPLTQVFWYRHTSALALFISDTPADLQPHWLRLNLWDVASDNEKIVPHGFALRTTPVHVWMKWMKFCKTDSRFRILPVKAQEQTSVRTTMKAFQMFLGLETSHTGLVCEYSGYSLGTGRRSHYILQYKAHASA